MMTERLVSVFQKRLSTKAADVAESAGAKIRAAWQYRPKESYRVLALSTVCKMVEEAVFAGNQNLHRETMQLATEFFREFSLHLPEIEPRLIFSAVEEGLNAYAVIELARSTKDVVARTQQSLGQAPSTQEDDSMTMALVETSVINSKRRIQREVSDLFEAEVLKASLNNEKAAIQGKGAGMNVNIHGSVSGSVTVGNNNQTTLNVSITELLQKIESSNGTQEEKAEAKSLLSSFLQHPLVASIVGAAAGAVL